MKSPLKLDFQLRKLEHEFIHECAAAVSLSAKKNKHCAAQLVMLEWLYLAEVQNIIVFLCFFDSTTGTCSTWERRHSEL